MAAKVKANSTSPNALRNKYKIKRKGVHSKKKNSSNPRSKNYRKPNRGQG